MGRRNGPSPCPVNTWCCVTVTVCLRERCRSDTTQTEHAIARSRSHLPGRQIQTFLCLHHCEVSFLLVTTSCSLTGEGRGQQCPMGTAREPLARSSPDSWVWDHGTNSCAFWCSSAEWTDARAAVRCRRKSKLRARQEAPGFTAVICPASWNRTAKGFFFFCYRSNDTSGCQ